MANGPSKRVRSNRPPAGGGACTTEPARQPASGPPTKRQRAANCSKPDLQANPEPPMIEGALPQDEVEHVLLSDSDSEAAREADKGAAAAPAATRPRQQRLRKGAARQLGDIEAGEGEDFFTDILRLPSGGINLRCKDEYERAKKRVKREKVDAVFLCRDAEPGSSTYRWRKNDLPNLKAGEE